MSRPPPRTTRRPPRWPLPEACTATQTPPSSAARPSGSLPIWGRADHGVVSRVDAYNAGSELGTHPDGASAEADARRSAGDADERLRLTGCRVDAGDGPVERVRDPERAVAVGDSGRACPDGRRRGHPVGRRVDTEDAMARFVGDPHRAASDGDPAAGCVGPDDLLHLAGGGVDARDRTVVCVRDPDRAEAVRHGGRPRADLDRLADDLIRLRADPADRVVVVVGDPDAAAADRDPARACADRDRLHRPRRRIDPRHGVGVRVRRPDDAVAADGDSGRCLLDGDLAGHPTVVAFDEADGVGGDDRSVRLPAPDHQVRGQTRHDERCDHDRDRGAATRQEPSAADGLGERDCGRIALVGARRGEFARQAFRAQLIETLGTVDVLQPELAEVGDPDVLREVVLDERPRRSGHQHLATVRRGRDPRRPVDADSHVPVAADGRLARVQAHPDEHRLTVRPGLCGERALRGHRRCGRCRRARERREDRVALRVHDLATLPLDDVAQDPLVLGEDVPVAVAEPLQQPGRSLDVREQEGDGSRRQLSHCARTDRTPVRAKSAMPSTSSVP